MARSRARNSLKSSNVWPGFPKSTGCRVANVFHAGDGNLHPLILFDANKEGELERAELVCSDILMLCVEVGGVLSGEHGIGVEKRRPDGRDVHGR